MASYKELLVQRMLLDFSSNSQATPEWSIKEISAYLKHTSITQTRAYIARIFGVDGTSSYLGGQNGEKIKRWLSDVGIAAPFEELFLIDVSCHCGAVCFTVDVAPVEVNACECSICWRYGALWAYYDEPSVTFPADNDSTDTYTDMCNEHRLEFHRCSFCGCVTHWRAVDGSQPRIGVNALMMPPDLIAEARFLRNGQPAE
ncbi:hypothetical protein SAMN05216466_11184 [Paraburkholderia phenazinium]|uniref:CENP-V/GFA domain-containing protein n=1 Tax=Paraburkholderia phenazinium TaxID=60549 RepID=A0A1G8DNB6_9BURK|nr:hypothetical protein [Paraburkholderia phenazinium]SDH58910.1 hypothetical protein SAMN05216466_11184 [Paraburkholderia phenazinium]